VSVSMAVASTEVERVICRAVVAVGVTGGGGGQGGTCPFQCLYKNSVFWAAWLRKDKLKKLGSGNSEISFLCRTPNEVSSDV
jgi:hypothetical protein